MRATTGHLFIGTILKVFTSAGTPAMDTDHISIYSEKINEGHEADDALVRLLYSQLHGLER